MSNQGNPILNLCGGEITKAIDLVVAFSRSLFKFAMLPDQPHKDPFKHNQVILNIQSIKNIRHATAAPEFSDEVLHKLFSLTESRKLSFEIGDKEYRGFDQRVFQPLDLVWRVFSRNECGEAQLTYFVRRSIRNYYQCSHCPEIANLFRMIAAGVRGLRARYTQERRNLPYEFVEEDLIGSFREKDVELFHISVVSSYEISGISERRY